WDEARGVDQLSVLDDRPFDTSDRRLLLQSLALEMQAAGKKEIETGELWRQLRAFFAGQTTSPGAAVRAAERFIKVIQERTGLLVEAGQGVYRFSHLTFQEYLAALAIIDRLYDSEYLLQRLVDPAWREVILLTIGQLSTQGTERATRLIRRIADAKNEPYRYYNLLLALDGIRDAGNAIDRTAAGEVEQRVRRILDKDRPAWTKAIPFVGGKGWMQEKGLLVEALVRGGPGYAGYWTAPYGEPEWITIPAGEFWMGSDERAEEKPPHRVLLPEYQIARVPVTNAQYLLYVQATGATPPEHWPDGQPPRNRTSHPVVNVTWHDAVRYCEWLSGVTGKAIRLPSEAEWEKAARGDKDQRRYPWGDMFDSARCNSEELGVGETSPVGVFPSGASPYGVLDMSGNVLEWTRSVYKEYPYKPDDGRENMDAGDESSRVWRGGTFGPTSAALPATGTIQTTWTPIWASGSRCLPSDSELWSL
ncbi:MAG: SUMF1/EgtB/PvdO family nonheme iron enzyme, partial [Anaerolineae bacterium]